MNQQQTRDAISECLGLLKSLEPIIVGDIGPLVYGVMVSCLTAQRDKIKVDDSVTKPMRDGRAT